MTLQVLQLLLRLVKVLKMPLIATCQVYGIHHGAEEMLVNLQLWS